MTQIINGFASSFDNPSFNKRRLEQMRAWLETLFGGQKWDLSAAAVDASTRRYFRIRAGAATHIVMDAPPENHLLRTFVDIGAALAGLRLQVPEVLAQNSAQGFLLLSDLGQRQYLDVLTEHNADALYDDAFTALARLQLGGDVNTTLLPVYDKAFILRELDIFQDWFLRQYMGLTLTEEDQAILAQAFDFLSVSALEQPRVWMHRDYHSRNLMVTDKHNPGVLDFQDAVIGPLTYDVVSLLRDCYIAWPRARVRAWALDYRARLRSLGFADVGAADTFMRWFDLMGLQRHLKAIGIFARLDLHYGKPGYLQDIPRTLTYVAQICSAYAELSALRRLLRERISNFPGIE